MSLFICLLRLVGMPWNKLTKSFAYLGGAGWLVFVWFGLITYAPMDMSGGSLVQSPHVQLRPASSRIRGHVDEIFVRPNDPVAKDQLIYSLDDEQYQIALNKAKAKLNAAQVSYSIAEEDVLIAEENYNAALQDIEIAKNKLVAGKEDLKWKQTTLSRYIKQNEAVKHTITETKMDEQRTEVEVAKAKQVTLQSELDKARVAATKARLAFEQSRLTVKSRGVDVATELENVAQAQWNLDQTKIYAPADGYVTNFIMREGQYVGVMPRMQMYTNEKYVLMRVNTRRSAM